MKMHAPVLEKENQWNHMKKKELKKHVACKKKEFGWWEDINQPGGCAFLTFPCMQLMSLEEKQMPWHVKNPQGCSIHQVVVLLKSLPSWRSKSHEKACQIHDSKCPKSLPLHCFAWAGRREVPNGQHEFQKHAWAMRQSLKSCERRSVPTIGLPELSTTAEKNQICSWWVQKATPSSLKQLSICTGGFQKRCFDGKPMKKREDMQQRVVAVVNGSNWMLFWCLQTGSSTTRVMASHWKKERKCNRKLLQLSMGATEHCSGLFKWATPQHTQSKKACMIGSVVSHRPENWRSLVNCFPCLTVWDVFFCPGRMPQLVLDLHPHSSLRGERTCQSWSLHFWMFLTTTTTTTTADVNFLLNHWRQTTWQDWCDGCFWMFRLQRLATQTWVCLWSSFERRCENAATGQQWKCWQQLQQWGQLLQWTQIKQAHTYSAIVSCPDWHHDTALVGKPLWNSRITHTSGLNLAVCACSRNDKFDQTVTGFR